EVDGAAHALQGRRATASHRRAPAARRSAAAEAGLVGGRGGVDGRAAARVELEVQVGDAGGVAAVAHVADDGAGLDPAGADVLVRRQVRAVVHVAVVAVDVPGQAAEAGRAVLDPAADRGDRRRAVVGHHVDALVRAAAGAGRAPGVGE